MSRFAKGSDATPAAHEFSSGHTQQFDAARRTAHSSIANQTRARLTNKQHQHYSNHERHQGGGDGGEPTINTQSQRLTNSQDLRASPHLTTVEPDDHSVMAHRSLNVATRDLLAPDLATISGQRKLPSRSDHLSSAFLSNLTATTDTTDLSWRPAELSRTFDEPSTIGLLSHDCHNHSQQSANLSMTHHLNRSLSSDCSTSSSSTTTSDGRLLLLNIPTDELNFSDIKDVWLVKSWQEILLRVSFVVPIVLLGLIGNLTIIYSMCRFKSIRSKPTNIFILNMALADLITSIVCPNAALLTDIYQFYMLGSFICRFEGFIKITCLLVSAYSLIVLSFDWFLCVVKPCRTRITIKQSWLALVSIWMVSVAMALPLLYWRNLRERRWKDLVEVWCCEHIQYTKYYWVGMTLFLIYLPTFIMTIVLIVILAQMDRFEAKLRRSRQNTSTILQGVSSSGQGPSIVSSASHASLSISSQAQINVGARAGTSEGDRGAAGGALKSSLSVSMKYRRRIVKILFFYLLTSIICWTPLQFVIVYRHFRTSAVPANWFFELAFYSQLCASLSAAMNPIIFGFLSQPFQRVVTKSWMFRFFDKVWTSNARNRSEQEQAKNNQFVMHNRRPNNARNNLNYARSSQRITRELEQPKLTIDYVEHNDELQATSDRIHPTGTNSSKRISVISNNNHSHRHRSTVSTHNHHNHHHHHHHHQHRHV